MTNRKKSDALRVARSLAELEDLINAILDGRKALAGTEEAPSEPAEASKPDRDA